jgi:hypothetical protein
MLLPSWAIRYPIGPWAGLGVVFAYTAVALLVAFWVVRRRDA